MTFDLPNKMPNEADAADVDLAREALAAARKTFPYLDTGSFLLGLGLAAQLACVEIDRQISQITKAGNN